MRLGKNTAYVLVETNPPDHRHMSAGDIVGVILEEPGGGKLRLSVRLTSVEPGGKFQGVTIATDSARAQFVGGSFVDPA